MEGIFLEIYNNQNYIHTENCFKQQLDFENDFYLTETMHQKFTNNHYSIEEGDRNGSYNVIITDKSGVRFR